MSDSIFDDNGQTPPVVVPPVTPSIPDPLKELVGEGKKYATLDKALESIPHAQAHIARLEQEAQELRQKQAEAIAVEEVYKKLMDSMHKNDGITPPVVSGLDEASVLAILEQREAALAAKANVTRVKDALVGKYGEKAQEVYETKARELGVSTDFLNEVVRKSPKAAEELFGIKPKDTPSGATVGSIRTDALNDSRPPAKPKSVMAGATTEDILSAWRAAKPQ